MNQRTVNDGARWESCCDFCPCLAPGGDVVDTQFDPFQASLPIHRHFCVNEGFATWSASRGAYHGRRLSHGGYATLASTTYCSPARALQIRRRVLYI